MRNRIININFNFYCPVSSMSFKEKICSIVAYIKSHVGEADIFSIQEFAAGKNLQFLHLLEKLLPEYQIILPRGVDVKKHPQTLLSLLIIRKKILGEYKVRVIEPDRPNRIVYFEGELKFENGGEVTREHQRIIVCHIPQIVNLSKQGYYYRCNQIESAARIRQEILKEVKKYANDNFILVGDFQESQDGENIKALKNEGLILVDEDRETVNNQFFAKNNRIDHIFVNKNNNIKPNRVFTEWHSELDHCLLIAE